MRVLGKSPWITIWLLVLATFSAFVPPLALLGAGVLGIWMVIGRENFWLRIMITSVYFLPSLQHRFEGPVLQLIVLLASVLLSYLANMLLKSLCKIPVPSAQFGLWEIGGWILVLSLVFTYFRLADIQMKHIDRVEAVLNVICAVCIAFNIVLTCCPFFVPKSLRFDKLWITAFGSQLLVMPLLEALACLSFVALIGRNVTASQISALFLGLFILHPLGLFFVMFVAWPMDADGYFRSDDPKKELT